MTTTHFLPGGRAINGCLTSLFFTVPRHTFFLTLEGGGVSPRLDWRRKLQRQGRTLEVRLCAVLEPGLPSRCLRARGSGCGASRIMLAPGGALCRPPRACSLRFFPLQGGGFRRRRPH